MKPMLASREKPDLSSIRYPVFALPKVDGIRALVRGGRILSRKLIAFPNSHVDSLLSRRELEGLDGELVLGNPTDPLLCSRTGGALRRLEGKPAVSFFCFDLWDSRLPYRQRLEDLKVRVDEARSLGLPVELMPYAEVLSEKQVLAVEEYYLERGYEGLILRHPEGLYKFGRATLKSQWMMKLKRFEDTEAKIVGFVELVHNENEATKDALGHTKRSKRKDGMVPGGVLGAFLCEDPRWPGVQFEVGGGMSDAQRKLYWQKRRFLKGKLVKFKHFPHGAQERPRNAVFLSIREEFD